MTRNAALVSGCFTAIVLIILTISFIQFKSYDPIRSPVLSRFIEDVHEGNTQKEFIDSVRAYDLLIRKAHFTSIAFTRFGGYLLLGGVLVLLAALKLMYEIKRSMPHPGMFKEPEEDVKKSLYLQLVIACFAALIVISAFVLPHFFSRGPQGFASVRETVLPEAFPSEEEQKENWGGFRGYRGLGVAYTDAIPVAWDVKTNEHIAWKTPIPKPGFNSPVIWGNKVFLSGADAAGREVYCFDLDSGDMVWKKAVSSASDTPMPDVSEDTGLAAPTVASNGKVVSAIFATGELITLDPDGAVLWEKKLELPDNAYGHASSLMIYRNILFVQYDHDGGAKLLAFDTSSGKKLWEQKRNVETSWTSPVIAPSSAGDQLILTATPFIVAYDPVSGSPLWRMENVIDGEIGPSPAFFNDRVYFINQYSVLACVDILKQKIIWEYDRSLSDIPSPVAYDGYLIVPTSFGKVTCFNAETGAVYWDHRFDTGFYASPVIAGDTVYLLDKKGIMRIFKLDKTFIPVSSPSLEEVCVATPAFNKNSIVIRGAQNLYRIKQ